VLGAAAILSFVTMAALLMTWRALTAGAGSFGLPRDAPRLVAAAFFWIFALLLDAVAVVAWVVALRVLLRRPAP